MKPRTPIDPVITFVLAILGGYVVYVIGWLVYVTWCQCD